MADVITQISSGRIRGTRSDGIAAFKGIPYAGSPAAEHRWLPPQPLESWDEVLDATDYGPSCPQPTQRPAGWSQELWEDESCLVLNVWTPALDDARRPVMVWYHGGLYSIGSGSWPLYDGTALAHRGDVVVVTVNHRLGALGYLHLAEIAGSDYATSGNAGMLDLVASLEWVRDNIEVFGGDPNKVTIFGESGGGSKVSALLAMPSARGLFHRAAIQSGPGLRVQSTDAANEYAEKLLSELGIQPGPQALEELHKVAPERIVAAQVAVSPRRGAGGPRGPMGGFVPVLDGTVFPKHPGDAFADGSAADVPILIGRNRDEGTLRMAADPILREPNLLDEDGLRERLRGFGDRAESLLSGYREALPDATPLDLLIAIQSDAFMGAGTWRFAERWLEGSSTPLFMYLFRWASGPLRSAHGFEIAFVFDNVRPPNMKSSESRTELGASMSEAWLAFARGGDPNHPGLPKWPAYTLEDRPTMIFDRGECKVENDPLGAQRKLWQRAD